MCKSSLNYRMTPCLKDETKGGREGRKEERNDVREGGMEEGREDRCVHLFKDKKLP